MEGGLPGASSAGGSGLGSGNGLKHIQSTAAMTKVPSGLLTKTGASPATEGEKRPAVGSPGGGEAGGEPSAKRRKALSVHFEGVAMEEVPGNALQQGLDSESMPPPPNHVAPAPAQPPAEASVPTTVQPRPPGTTEDK